jgi:glutamine amidotransferase
VCRHLAARGGPDFDGWSAGDLLFDAPHALARQAQFPAHQSTGKDNPDGWGVAWYRTADQPPLLHRTVTSIWADREFVPTARGIECATVLAAARLASPGLAIDASGNAPFVRAGWAFSLNGAVDGFGSEVGDALRGAITPARRTQLESDTDSEVLFALTLDRIDAGAPPANALAAVMHHVTGITTGRINLLMTDGDRVWATRWVNSLFTRGAVVASEPVDTANGWTGVPDRSLVVLDADGTRIDPL